MTGRSPAHQVRLFHEAFRLPIAETPALVDGGLARQRHQLLLSEVTEVYDAVLKNNLAGVAQELADCVYVLYGTALVYGIDLDAVVAEVHEANMTKMPADGVPLVVDGKIMKGENYRKPDVAAVLGRQGMERDGYGYGPVHQLTVTLIEHVATALVPQFPPAPHYELEHPVECNDLPYGQRCSLDEIGDDRTDWPTKPGTYNISSWASKTWTDMGWEYDAGVQWEDVS